MILCSNCKHANMTGAIFCSECGSQLIGKDALTTQTIITDRLKTGPTKVDDSYQAFDGSDAWGSLHLLDTGQVLPLSTRTEFTLGLVSEGQPMVPDMDLSRS